MSWHIKQLNSVACYSYIDRNSELTLFNFFHVTVKSCIVTMRVYYDYWPNSNVK